ncbi:E2F/DP family winged-helix DNA-binding domain-containing protein [Giardia muris]|uniref:E2F/DP family winged-helix DNA-binding domain-containing protein n=1 Tax=Giardia muris TaxID=5742 RepID=A0A4Z1SW71_GIAMU|nr:E2F/DP family winged-helix DNA-binding domain-containing protein [Giardia muris]|eukprot:TNJ30024.1 E2F/DP family winged-helix DNA-binding domain-containing protein [Giardia muris]
MVAQARAEPKVRKLVDLTRRFFAIACNHDEPFEFTIKEVCDKLLIESRRLYDLINVLEALGIIVKRQGSHYEFIGLLNVDRAVQAFVDRAISGTSSAAHNIDSNSRFKLHELSIWFMTQLIRASPQSISLISVEATLNLKSSQVRRLYDITNILEGMRLITISNQRGSKPSYYWNEGRLSDVCRNIIGKVEEPRSTSTSDSSADYSTETSSESHEADTSPQRSPSSDILDSKSNPPAHRPQLRVVNLMTPSRALLVDNSEYWGIDQDTPQTRRFIDSLLKLSQSKVSAATSGLGQSVTCITPLGTIWPVDGTTATEQTPNLHRLYQEMRVNNNAESEFLVLDALDPAALVDSGSSM